VTFEGYPRLSTIVPIDFLLLSRNNHVSMLHCFQNITTY